MPKGKATPSVAGSGGSPFCAMSTPLHRIVQAGNRVPKERCTSCHFRDAKEGGHLCIECEEREERDIEYAKVVHLD